MEQASSTSLTNPGLINEAEDIIQDPGYGSSESATRLHPDKFDHAHIDSIEKFTQDLQQAIKGSFPRESDPYPYTSVTVLMLRWEDDDLYVEDEILDLDAVFRRRFGFDTEVWCIPSSPNPTRALQKKLYAFQEAHEDEKELLIVYYGGHGEADPLRGRSIWRANLKEDSPSLNWWSLQPLLETAVPSVLIILDCCFAANAVRDTTTGTTKELLAACARENPTSAVGERSFTSALIDELKGFGSDAFTVTRLHTRLMTIRWRLVFTPVYALLSEHGGPSIHLEPHPSKKIKKKEHEHTAPERVRNGDTRVLLAITITQNPDLSLERWDQWLRTGTPSEVLQIDARLESIFESHSTLALISVSIEAWDRLREDEAYQFVAFTQSRNLLLDGDDALKTTEGPKLKAILPASQSSSARRSVNAEHLALGTPSAIPEDETMIDPHTTTDHPRSKAESVSADSGYGSKYSSSTYSSRRADIKHYPVPIIQNNSALKPEYGYSVVDGRYNKGSSLSDGYGPQPRQP